MFAVSLPVLLGLSVLVLDAGNLYLTRLRLDKAVREASGTALSMMSLNGWSSLVAGGDTGVCPGGGSGSGGGHSGDDDDDDDDDGAGPGNDSGNGKCKGKRCGKKTGSQSNSKHAHCTPDTAKILDTMKTIVDRVKPKNSTTPPTYFSSDGNGGWIQSNNGFTVEALILKGHSSVSIRIESMVQTLLLGVLAGALGDIFPTDLCKDGKCKVTSTPNQTSGSIRPAKIFLLLDTSGSMAEEVGGTPKLDSLVEATSSFIDMFNPQKDEIGYIDFATTYKNINRPATFAAASGDYLQIKEEIAGLSAGGMTNPCDALIETLQQVPEDNTEPTFVVLFTDGAPNVYRMNFCRNNNCQANLGSGAYGRYPGRLNDQLKLSPLGLNNDSVQQGWYGWTVNWGKRETYCAVGDKEDGFNCDPVFSFPKLQRGGVELAEAEARTASLNEDGLPTVPGAPSSDVSLVFDDTAPGNYQWFGPSYLVHASEKDNLQGALVDRIPSQTAAAPLTCGPGSRSPYRGFEVESPSPDGKKFPDNLNHSKYFASRVLDREWQLWGDHRDFPIHRARLLGLDTVPATPAAEGNAIRAPAYFPSLEDGSRPRIGHTGKATYRTGCLDRLSGFLPFNTDARIYVGKKFVSNTDSDSIKTVGEIVKTAELPYYCAIRAADELRKRNVRIFTIGLGAPASATYGNNCNDPMENALDFNSRKDKFLTRLALDPRSLVDPKTAYGTASLSEWNTSYSFAYGEKTIQSCGPHPLNGQTVAIGYGEDGVPEAPGNHQPSGHGFTRDHVGLYFPASDPSQLRAVFAQIAKKILLELSL